MKIYRSEHIAIVKNRLVSTPTEVLDLYIEPQDVIDLADPRRRYTMDRFMGCSDTGSIPGWASEDKIHMRLETPVRTEDEEKLAELSLDPGGDLYFKIWDSHPLRVATEHEEFTDMSTFVASDPHDKLRTVGIEIIRLHQLSELAEALGAHK